MLYPYPMLIKIEKGLESGNPRTSPLLRFSSVDMYVSTKINRTIINQRLRNKIFAPIKTNEIAISAREYLLKFAAEQYAGVQGLSYATIYHQLEDRDGHKKTVKFLKTLLKNMEHKLSSLVSKV
jgi:hypothetical protein